MSNIQGEFPPTTCPHCGHKVNAYTGSRTPEESDLLMCFQCLKLTKFNKDRKLVALDPVDEAYFEAMQEIKDMRMFMHSHKMASRAGNN